VSAAFARDLGWMPEWERGQRPRIFSWNGHDMGWPTCARCRKPVDVVEHVNAFDVYGWTFRVSCHGEHEETTITCEAVRSMRTVIKFGEAFAPSQPPAIGHEGESDES
jgi:hypothetical protein